MTCSPLAVGQVTLPDPVLVIEILSSNQAKTWTNVWAYTSILSVREILVLRADRIAAELLRRSPQGEWPDRPIAIIWRLAHPLPAVLYQRYRTLLTT